MFSNVKAWPVAQLRPAPQQAPERAGRPGLRVFDTLSMDGLGAVRHRGCIRRAREIAFRDFPQVLSRGSSEARGELPRLLFANSGDSTRGASCNGKFGPWDSGLGLDSAGRPGSKRCSGRPKPSFAAFCLRTGCHHAHPPQDPPRDLYTRYPFPVPPRQNYQMQRPRPQSSPRKRSSISYFV